MTRMKILPSAALLSVGLILAACSSDSDEENNASQNGGGSNGSSQEEQALTPEEITELIFAGETPETADVDDLEKPKGGELNGVESVAEGEGKITDGGDKIPVTVNVAEVVDLGSRLFVQYSLQSSDGDDHHSSAQTHLGDEQPSSVMDGVTVVDSKDGIRYWPLTAIDSDEESEKCACAPIPNSIGPNEEWFFGFYPPLDSDADSVEIEVPGVDPIEVPIQRVDQ